MKTVFASLFLMAFTACCWGQQLGRFTGDLIFKWDPPPSREMTLLQPISFIDPRGVVWEVPAGAKTDGASIPRVFWTVVAAPFEGPHRDAAVVHDYFCETRTRSWRDTHRVFYDGMLARSVDTVLAKIMYAAVYHFGPRWGEVGGATRGKGDALPARKQEEQMQELKAWIAAENPNLETLETKLDSLPVR